MFFSSRMPLKPLAALCRRLATALTAGLDLRTILTREAQQARGLGARRRLAEISRAVNHGESLSDALAATGDFFPPLFREMVEVGEQSGHLAEVLAQLAAHYEGLVQLRRTFLAAIAWPMIQLGLALGVVGLLIWVTGWIRESTHSNIDILGCGLFGNRGLAIYAIVLGAAGTLLWLGVRAVKRGVVWLRPIQRLVLQIPVLGPALQTLSLARLAWTLYLTTIAGVEVRRALRLSLRSTGNARYTDQIELVEAEINAGNSIYAAFYAAGCFPADFLDALQVAEQSGKLDEAMAHLARQYQEQARVALTTLTMLAGFAVWGLVAMLIVVLIFRIFGFYLNTIKSAMP